MEQINVNQEEEEEVKQSVFDEKQYLDVLKHYAGDEEIPKELRSRQWSIFGKAMVNTFLEERDLPLIDINLEILKIGEMSAKPAHLLTFNEVNQLEKMYHYTFITAKRAIGFKGSKMNERTLQNTQISQSIGMQQMPQKRSKFLGLI